MCSIFRAAYAQHPCLQSSSRYQVHHSDVEQVSATAEQKRHIMCDRVSAIKSDGGWLEVLQNDMPEFVLIKLILF
jgi:hypothetical protein